MYDSISKNSAITGNIQMGNDGLVGVANRQSEINELIIMQQNAIETFDQSLSNLVNRLGAVLSESTPTTDKMKEGETPRSELGKRIYDNNSRIQYLNSRINDVLQRLQL